MKIYIGHSTSLNYREELYRPLKDSSLEAVTDQVHRYGDGSDLVDVIEKNIG